MEVVSKVQQFTDEDLSKLLAKLTKLLDSSDSLKSTETATTLRSIFQVLNARPNEFDVPDDVVQKIYFAVEDEKTPLKTRALCAFVLNELIYGDVSFLKENLRQYKKNYLAAVLPLLLSLGTQDCYQSNLNNIIYWISAEDYSLRSSTLPAVAHMARKYPTMLQYKKHLKPIETQMLKWLVSASTVSAKPNAAGGLLLKLNISKPIPVTEMDGSPSRDFFTVLNISQLYTEDQVFNIHAFSMLFTWLQLLYHNRKNELYSTIKRTKSDANLISSPVTSPGGPPTDSNTSDQNDSASTPTELYRLDFDFQENLIKYCLRVIDQAKIKLPNVDNAAKSLQQTNREVADIAMLESIRVLDSLCSLDEALVPKLFPIMKKLFNIIKARSAAETTNTSQTSNSSQLTLSYSPAIERIGGLIDLALLQFFLNHSEKVVYDPEPLFRSYFETCLSNNYKDPVLAFETLNFCAQNKVALLNNTIVFQRYFPPLMKLYAWHPTDFYLDIEELFPAFIGPSTYMELFHSILDLPLLAAALERIEYERDEDIISTSASLTASTTSTVPSSPLPSNHSSMSNIPPLSSIATPTKYPSLSRNASISNFDSLMSPGQRTHSNVEVSADWYRNKYRVLYNYLLRNESGVTINFWDSSTTLGLITNFCKEISISPRTQLVSKQAVTLLHLYFDVLIAYGDERDLESMIPIMLERMDQLFPLEVYQDQIRKVLIDKIVAIFEKCPTFIYTLKKWIVMMMNDSGVNRQREELVLHLCWLIGEYCQPNGAAGPQIMHDYEEMLELFAFERMSLASMTANQEADDTTAEGQHQLHEMRYNNRVMSVVINSLTKLAARWQPLTSRVQLCLHKILRYKNYFLPSVISHANLCLNLLKSPSIAASILDSRHRTELATSHLDVNSSLPFLLSDTSDLVAGRKIHEFGNW
jgi:AP-5 complex subunit zeta-1